MDFEKFKPLTAADRFVGMDKTISSAQYAYGDGSETDADQSLTWYCVSRDVSQFNTDDLKHLFMSFGLARELDLDENDINQIFGAIDWYNGKNMLIATIPQTGCGTYVDGAVVALRVPTGTSAADYVEFYGSAYKGRYDSRTDFDVATPYENSVYGGASTYLFPNTYGPHSVDELTEFGEMPYTGTIDGIIHPNAGVNSWTGSNVNNKTFFPHVRATHFSRNPDNGNDVVHGIALLEKGFFVIFDDLAGVANSRDFVGDVMTANTAVWTAETAGTFVAMTVTGGSAEQNSNTGNLRAIQFTGTAANNNARLFYRTVTEEFKFVYFCHAGQNEFNSTSNHTYDHRKAFFRPEEADDIYVTEVALYDDDNEIIAYAKLSEPVVKNQLETLTFKVELTIGND